MTKTFTKEQLIDEYNILGNGSKDCTVISDEIVDTTRWSIIHTVVFTTPELPVGQAYMVHYSVGATE